MRIVIVTEVFLPKVDGITNRLANTIRELKRSGHVVLVIAPTRSLPEYEGAEVVRVASCPLPVYPEARVAWFSPRVATRIGRFKPDVVHVVGPACLGHWAVVITKMLRIPLVASYQTDFAAYLKLYKAQWVSPFYWPFMRFFHNMGQVNLCPSRHAQNELRSHGFKNVGLWRGSVDLDLFHPSKRCFETRNELSRGNPNDPLAVFVGRVSAEKGVDTLEPVFRRYPNLRVAIVGDGPAREEFEKRFSPYNVHFTGYKRGEDLAKAFASADLFVNPSVTETLGFVTLEAMASGLPVIAAKAGGTTDLIDHGRSGVLYDPAQPSQLIDAVGEVLDNGALRRRLATAARLFTEESSWEAQTAILLRKYEEAIELAGKRKPVGREPLIPAETTAPLSRVSLRGNQHSALGTSVSSSEKPCDHPRPQTQSMGARW